LWLDPIISPQLVSVATMILVAVLVLTNTVSADGSISGVYDAGLALAERTGQSSQALPKELKQINEAPQDKPAPPPPVQKHGADQQKDGSGAKSDTNGHNNR
jgi:hypothetical protein